MALLRQIGATRADEASAILRAAGMGATTMDNAPLADGTLPDAPTGASLPTLNAPADPDLLSLAWGAGGVVLGGLVASLAGGGRTMAGTVGKISGKAVVGLAAVAGAGYFFLYRPWAQLKAAKALILGWGYSTAADQAAVMAAVPQMSKEELLGFASVLDFIRQPTWTAASSLPADLQATLNAIITKYSIPGI